ncbi:MAG: hypothetical protein ACLUUN_04205 [Muribaculaceae bacterium]
MLKISQKGQLVLRGEAVISLGDFDNINEEMSPEEKYKNPRNLCSGTVQQIQKFVQEKCLFVAFQLYAEGMNFEKKSQGFEYLKSLPTVVKRKFVNSENIAQAVSV